MWWAAVSRAVDQSSTRNKRNDRLAEGHDRVAGAGTVLRERKQCASLSTLERVGKYLLSMRDPALALSTFRVWLVVSLWALLRATFRLSLPDGSFGRCSPYPRSAASAPFFKAANP